MLFCYPARWVFPLGWRLATLLIDGHLAHQESWGKKLPVEWLVGIVPMVNHWVSIYKRLGAPIHSQSGMIILIPNSSLPMLKNQGFLTLNLAADLSNSKFWICKDLGIIQYPPFSSIFQRPITPVTHVVSRRWWCPLRLAVSMSHWPPILSWKSGRPSWMKALHRAALSNIAAGGCWWLLSCWLWLSSAKKHVEILVLFLVLSKLSNFSNG